LNIDPWVALATSSGGNTGYFVDELNRYLMHGTMSPEMKSAIVTAVNAVTPSTNYTKKAQTALYLVLTSPQYHIVR
jgi:hypothetical protein